MTTTDFTERIKAATANKTPLRIRGGGSKDWYGQQLLGDILDTRSYAGIIDYDPSELVISAKCGTSLSELQSTLREQRQMLAFEPPAFGADATIGGVIAAGLSGPRRASCGAARDFLLGTVLLNGAGERLVFGGQVMKNVAGYDVSRLLAGSMGCLGLILEMSIKVLPMPHSEITICFDLPQADALRRLNSWASKPLPISASSWENQRLTIRLSGSEAATKSALQQLGGDQLGTEQAEQYWNSLREQSHEFFQGQDTVWRLSVPTTAPELDVDGKQLVEWNGAQRWLINSSFSAERLRQIAQAAGGNATLFKGGDKSVGVFQALPATHLNIHQRLKSAFDPAGIFNPGRLYPEL